MIVTPEAKANRRRQYTATTPVVARSATIDRASAAFPGSGFAALQRRGGGRPRLGGFVGARGVGAL